MRALKAYLLFFQFSVYLLHDKEIDKKFIDEITIKHDILLNPIKNNLNSRCQLFLDSHLLNTY